MTPLVVPVILLVAVAITSQGQPAHREPSPTPVPRRNVNGEKMGKITETNIDLGPYPLSMGALPVPHTATNTLPATTRGITTSLERATDRRDRLPPPKPRVMPKTKLTSLLNQPLPIAVEAARYRFMHGAVRDVRQGDGQIIVELDPRSTASVLIPPAYLGWPVVLIEAKE